MSAQSYIVALKAPTGEPLEWETLAESLCQAVKAANELMPQCEITKVSLKHDW